MAMARKVEITQRETIKPSSPTPIHLKILNLSLLEQLTPFYYIPLVLFYPANCSEKAPKLKKSLSETLTHFYPLAGRIKGNTYVECEDQGVDFIEAKINCPLSDILKNPNQLDLFMPVPVFSAEAATGGLLLVQATFFDCGGLAVGICISHKIADAVTLSSFIKCWSALTANNSADVVSPVFVGASIFPPTEISIPSNQAIQPMESNCITSRFLFTPSKIADLRAKMVGTTVPNPTRVEVVSALLWKTAMSSARSKFWYSRASMFSISLNMRNRLLPPLPENSAGLFVWPMAAKMETGEFETEFLKESVGRIRKEKEMFDEQYVRKFQGEGALSTIFEKLKEYGDMGTMSNMDIYYCTSWCKLELYDADFGWGKPVWLCNPNLPMKNTALLMDTRDGNGIEAFFTLEEEDMALFESNQELLQFAEVNPRVSF
ncbi:stemmadenine O-acetyltransferase-like [Mercurialis annua]|uniref:stemmadenine O-acetyltransferase-like n=1 Tax=Mercurialis annua TaxID=3986 RepID=UPI0021610A2F|nr:stemmadenine O-acetyltransferase-like [Mercurialis annua]